MKRALVHFAVARCPRPWSGCHLDCQTLMQSMTFGHRQPMIFPVQSIPRDSVRQVAGALQAGGLPLLLRLRTAGPMPLMQLLTPAKVDPARAQIVSI
jgi:hypothetical protein